MSTFKGMLKIVVDDYKKQHEQKMFSVVEELLRTRRELQEVKEQLRLLQLSFTAPSSSTTESNIVVSKINLFVQYNGFFNELCDISQTMTIKELMVKLRETTGMSLNHQIRIRVLSEDGLTALFFLDNELDRTIESYKDILKPKMILSIEDEHKPISKKAHLVKSASVISSERRQSDV